MYSKNFNINKLKIVFFSLFFCINFWLNELIAIFLQCFYDNRGRFLIPIEQKITDEEFKIYRHLKIDWSIPCVKADDLPEEFSRKALNVVDMFRRKTKNIDYECNLFFDYITGEILACFIGEENFVEGEINEDLLKRYNVCSIHNHTNKYYSPPSSGNFEILKIPSENYEIISSSNCLWVIEAKEVSDIYLHKLINNHVYFLFIFAKHIIYEDYGFEIPILVEDLYSLFLLNYLYDYNHIIKITKTEM